MANHAIALYTSLGLVGFGGAVFGGGLQYLAGTSLLIASGGALHQQLQKEGKGFGSAVESLGLVGSDLWSGVVSLAGEDNVRTVHRVVVAALPDLGLNDVPIDENGFISNARALRSKWIIGPKGSLKTRLAVYLNGRILEAAPGTALMIGDPHWPSSDVDWMPGLPKEQFEEFHLKTNAEDIYQTVLEMEAEMEHRLGQNLTDMRPLHFVIDEFVKGVYAKLSETQRQRLVDAIANIQFQGRKAKVDVTCILHSAKKDQCGLDSSLFLNGDCYLMGTAGADQLQQKNLPGDFNWNKLLSAREIAVKSANNPKQVIIYRDQDTGLSAVELLPDPILQFSAPPLITFEHPAIASPDEWIEHYRELITDLIISKGIAPSTISKNFSAELKRPDGKNLRRNKNADGTYSDPYYAALVQFGEQLKTQAAEVEA